MYKISVLCFPFCSDRSESPSQVFFILIQWLLALVKLAGGYEKLGEICLAYDNMCHLDGLNAAKKPLPFPAPLNKLWINVHKFIFELSVFKSCEHFQAL